MHRRPHPTRLLAVALLLGGSLLVGCSAGGDDAGEATTTEAAAETTTATTEAEDEPTTTTEVEQTPTTADEGSLAAWEEAFGDAVEDSEVAGPVDPDADVPTDETADECVARLWLDIITVEALGALGLTPDDLATVDLTEVLPELVDLDQAQQLLDAAIECGLDPLATLIDGMVESGLTEEQAACIVDTAPPGTFEQAIALTFDQGPDALEQDPDFEATVQAAAQECLAAG